MVGNLLKSGLQKAYSIINKFYSIKNRSEDPMVELEKAMEGLSV